MKSIKLLLLFSGFSLGALPGLAKSSTPTPVASAGSIIEEYGQFILEGNREGLIRLYAARDIFVLGDGVDGLRSPAEIEAYYRKDWPAPADFAWGELVYQEMSPDVVIVSGSFERKDAQDPNGARYNYSATLVREPGGWKIRSETQFRVAPPANTPAEAAAAGSLTLQQKIARTKLRNFARAYEPVQLGLTYDEHDELFMDFTLSLMFPLLGDYWDAQEAVNNQSRFSRWLYEKHLGLFFSGTVRAGQYIAGRPSAPVVEKRFNPQLFVRYWRPDADNKLAAHRYFDFIFYGHESNGQSINSLATFDQQKEIYRQLEKHPESEEADERAHLSARDTISRGWDYVGFEGSWALNENHHLRLKVREFLPYGRLQKGAEQSHDWEDHGPTHPRRQYDGLMLQFSGYGTVIEKWPWLSGRYTFTYTTGLSSPGKNSTFQLDLGAEIFRRPINIWVRTGYNSDLTDYYRYVNSVGGGITIWSF